MLDIKIQDFLPHEYPMLMLDGVVEISAERVHTSFYINQENIFIKDNHFTEAGLIENTAQTCSMIVAYPIIDMEGYDPSENKKIMGYISAVQNLEIYALPGAGLTLHTKAELVNRAWLTDFVLCELKCETYDNESLVMTTNMKLMLKSVSHEKE